MHTTPLYKAEFTGMRVRVLEQRGNPCEQPELQQHFHCWYRLITLTTTPKNKHIPPGYWYMKLVSVKPSWNPLLRSLYRDKHALLVAVDDVVVAVNYEVDIVNGQPTDIVVFTMKSMEDGFEYLALVRIQHGMTPLIPMKKTHPNAML